MKSPIIYLFLQCFKPCWLSFTYQSLFISYLWILSSCSWNKIVIFFKHNCSFNTLPIKCEILNLHNSINIYTDIYNLVPFVLSRRKYEFNEWWSIVFISLCLVVIMFHKYIVKLRHCLVFWTILWEKCIWYYGSRWHIRRKKTSKHEGHSKNCSKWKTLVQMNIFMYKNN